MAGACQPPEPDRSLERVRAVGQLVVGTDASFPPFSSVNGQGQLVGYEIDLAGELARRMGVRAAFVNVDTGSILDALLVGKLDVVIAGFPPLPEYAKDFGYSAPYFNSGQVLVVPLGSAIVGEGDLAYRTVGVESGSAADLVAEELTNRWEDLRPRRYNTAREALEAARNGDVQAAIADAITAAEFVRDQGGVHIVGRALIVEPYVIVARKGDAALLVEVNRLLSAMRADGYLAQLIHKWLQ